MASSQEPDTSAWHGADVHDDNFAPRSNTGALAAIHEPDAAVSDVSTFPPQTRYGGHSPLVNGYSGASLQVPRSTLSVPHHTQSPYEDSLAEDEDTVQQNSQSGKSPFGFQPQQYTARGVSPPKTQDIGRRRGHKYKHSSISHNIFLEPTHPRTPLPLPSSLDIPTFREFRTSTTPDQRLRALWCLTHLSVAAYIQWSGHGSLAMTALSHLLFFDAAGAFLCVAVDVCSNFEVWKRSSLRHPFGLERVEILAGLAMSIGLLFMGLDLISHNLQHSLERAGGHEPHHQHPHDAKLTARVPAGSVDIAALAAIAATLVSALALRNHEHMGRALHFSLPFMPKSTTQRGASGVAGSLLGNPTHVLTLSCSALLLVLPLLSFTMYRWLDALLSVLIALSMLALGAHLCFALGRMLLMSAPGGVGVTASSSSMSGKEQGGGVGAGAAAAAGVVAAIEADAGVERVVESRFWQVHYGLCMANLKIRLKCPAGAGMGSASDQEVERVREMISSLVTGRLGGSCGGDTASELRWEISTQIMFGPETHAQGNGHVHSHVHSHGHAHGHSHNHA